MPTERKKKKKKGTALQGKNYNIFELYTRFNDSILDPPINAVSRFQRNIWVYRGDMNYQ